jgi:signal transduction histidine kinase
MTRVNQIKQLAVRYFGALHAAVTADSVEGSAELARDLGVQADQLGLGTPELAGIHEQALAELKPEGGERIASKRLIARAAVFFNATLEPIQKSHRAVQKIEAGLVMVNKALRQRTLELAASGRKLKTGIAERKLADASLTLSKTKSEQLVKESRELEADLRMVTHRLYKVEEGERKKMSLRVHDGIAMTLLGIHVRLLTLQKAVASNHTSLNREIAITRRLVARASKTINHFNLEFGICDDSKLAPLG